MARLIHRWQTAAARMGLGKPRVAFVFGGGGNLGAVQVGMLRALIERGITPDLVVGCSVGSINGAAFAADPTLAGIQKLEDVWLDLERFDIMSSGRLPPAVLLAKRAASMHANTGLRSMIEECLPVRHFDELAIPFQCVATRVEDAEEVWFTEGVVVDALLASAALPLVYPPMVLDGVRYLDGGVVNDVPISRAVELGATHLYLLTVGNLERTHEEAKRPLDVAVQAFWLARQHRYRADLAALPEHVFATVLPTGETPDLGYRDFDSSGELINEAYTATAARLDAQAERGPDQRRPLGRRPEWTRTVTRPATSADNPPGAVVDDSMDRGWLDESSLVEDELWPPVRSSMPATPVVVVDGGQGGSEGLDHEVAPPVSEAIAHRPAESVADKAEADTDPASEAEDVATPPPGSILPRLQARRDR